MTSGIKIDRVWSALLLLIFLMSCESFKTTSNSYTQTWLTCQHNSQRLKRSTHLDMMSDTSFYTSFIDLLQLTSWEVLEAAIAPLLLVAGQVNANKNLQEIEEKYNALQSKLNQSSNVVQDFNEDMKTSLSIYKDLYEGVNSKLEVVLSAEEKRSRFEQALTLSLQSLDGIAKDMESLRRSDDEIRNELDRSKRRYDAKLTNLNTKQSELGNELTQAQRLNARERAAMRQDIQKEIVSVSDSMKEGLSVQPMKSEQYDSAISELKKKLMSVSSRLDEFSELKDGTEQFRQQSEFNFEKLDKELKSTVERLRVLDATPTSKDNMPAGTFATQAEMIALSKDISALKAEMSSLDLARKMDSNEVATMQRSLSELGNRVQSAVDASEQRNDPASASSSSNSVIDVAALNEELAKMKAEFGSLKADSLASLSAVNLKMEQGDDQLSAMNSMLNDLTTNIQTLESLSQQNNSQVNEQIEGMNANLLSELGDLKEMVQATNFDMDNALEQIDSKQGGFQNEMKTFTQDFIKESGRKLLAIENQVKLLATTADLNEIEQRQLASQLDHTLASLRAELNAQVDSKTSEMMEDMDKKLLTGLREDFNNLVANTETNLKSEIKGYKADYIAVEQKLDRRINSVAQAQRADSVQLRYDVHNELNTIKLQNRKDADFIESKVQHRMSANQKEIHRVEQNLTNNLVKIEREVDEKIDEAIEDKRFRKRVRRGLGRVVNGTKSVGRRIFGRFSRKKADE